MTRFQCGAAPLLPFPTIRRVSAFVTALFCALSAPLAAQDTTTPALTLPQTRPQIRPDDLKTPTPEEIAAAVAAVTEAAAERDRSERAQNERNEAGVRPPTPGVPDAAALAAPSDVTLGPETNLPLPRFVSLKTREGNVRRGPSLSHRIDWVFTREDMPLMVTAEYGHWRRVVDREGLGGWVHYALISGTRTVIVDADMQPLYRRPNADATQNALLEAGVIARLEECNIDWCRVAAGGFGGWLPKSAIWGVGPDEILD